MTLHSAQNDIANCQSRYRVLCCGRRFGKTTLAAEEIKAIAIYRTSRVCYIAPTYQQARDIAWEALKAGLHGATIQANESRLELRIRNRKDGESIIILRGWESIETLRGQAFDFVVIDEIAMMRNFWLNWNEVIRPTLTDKKGSVLFISTPKGFNHFYDLYNMQEKDSDYKSFHFTSYDNPHLPKDELDKAKKELPEDQFAQEYLASFRKSEGLVYKEFSRDRHVFTDESLARQARISASAVIIGIDWGYTNPCAILKAYKDKDSHYWFVEEYYKTGKTDDEISEYAKSLGGTFYYPDPAEPDRVESLRRRGLNVRDVSNDIEAGISSVRALLKEGRIHIHFSLVNTINEFETYHYGKKKPDNNEPEKPIDENNHSMASIRYMLHMQSPIVTSTRAKQFIPDYGRGANSGYKYRQ